MKVRLKYGVLVLGLFLIVGTYCSSIAAPSVAEFRFAPVNENALGLWEGDRPVLVYNHGSITHSSFPTAASHTAYVHPLYGLDGEVLTGDFPKDHVYHRGLYWAWPHIQIGDKEYDLWSLRGIQQKFQRWLIRETKPQLATLGVENGWFVGEKQVMREQALIRVHPAGAESRAIDLELSWTPLERPITLWGAPGKSYGGLNLRFGDRSKTAISIPSGRTSEDLVVTKLPWADFTGDFRAQDALSGAAIFVHPDHPAFPPEWMTRHYGILAVGYPGVTPRSFPPNETFTCRYRVWVHRGHPESAAIQRAFESYGAEIKAVAR